MAKNISEMNQNCFILTDGEDGIRNAIKKYMPTVPLLRCWKHFFGTTAEWLRRRLFFKTKF